MGLLLAAQIFFLLDILVNFFLATRVEGDEEIYVTDPIQISINYLKGKFITDLILTLPFGFLGNLINPIFSVLHLLKAYRIQQFYFFFQATFYQPKIRTFYSWRLKQVLRDENKKFNMNDSNNFIMARL